MTATILPVAARDDRVTGSVGVVAAVLGTLELSAEVAAALGTT